MKYIDIEISPQTTMIAASQRRAPKRSSARFDGIPRITYPREKIPAPIPKMVSLKPRSSSS